MPLPKSTDATTPTAAAVTPAPEMHTNVGRTAQRFELGDEFANSLAARKWSATDEQLRRIKTKELNRLLKRMNVAKGVAREIKRRRRTLLNR